MTILDALRRGVKGEKVKREGGEWLTVCSDGKTLRFVNNRQVFHPNVTDILAEDWIAENDFLLVSNRQLEAIFNSLGVNSEEQKVAMKKLGYT